MRKSAAAVALAAYVLVIPACGDDAVAGPGPGSEPGPGPTSDVQVFSQRMNEVRVEAGCQPLGWRSDVALVAAEHSADMVERDFFSHTNPDGAGPGDRLDAAGIDYTGWGENIAAGTSDPEHVLDLWMNSPGHRANIERCSFTEHGVGLVSGHWTHVFLTSPTN